MFWWIGIASGSQVIVPAGTNLREPVQTPYGLMAALDVHQACKSANAVVGEVYAVQEVDIPITANGVPNGHIRYQAIDLRVVRSYWGEDAPTIRIHVQPGKPEPEPGQLYVVGYARLQQDTPSLAAGTVITSLAKPLPLRNDAPLEADGGLELPSEEGLRAWLLPVCEERGWPVAAGLGNRSD